MRFFSSFLLVAGCAVSLLAAARDGALLDYRLRVRMRDEPAAVDYRFRMIAAPPLVTGNKVKRPRMGSWRLEAEAGAGGTPSPALLARTLRMCYFSGPTAQSVPLQSGLRLGGRWCRLWQVQTPPEVGAYAYLAEVAPNLLALAYLSAYLPGGEVQSVEIHLADAALGPRAAPAEEGTALLDTLRHWSEPPAGALAGGELETEAVQ